MECRSRWHMGQKEEVTNDLFHFSDSHLFYHAMAKPKQSALSSMCMDRVSKVPINDVMHKNAIGWRAASHELHLTSGGHPHDTPPTPPSLYFPALMPSSSFSRPKLWSRIGPPIAIILVSHQIHEKTLGILCLATYKHDPL